MAKKGVFPFDRVTVRKIYDVIRTTTEPVSDDPVLRRRYCENLSDCIREIAQRINLQLTTQQADKMRRALQEQKLTRYVRPRTKKELFAIECLVLATGEEALTRESGDRTPDAPPEPEQSPLLLSCQRVYSTLRKRARVHRGEGELVISLEEARRILKQRYPKRPWEASLERFLKTKAVDLGTLDGVSMIVFRMQPIPAKAHFDSLTNPEPELMSKEVPMEPSLPSPTLPTVPAPAPVRLSQERIGIYLVSRTEEHRRCFDELGEWERIVRRIRNDQPLRLCEPWQVSPPTVEQLEFFGRLVAAEILRPVPEDPGTYQLVHDLDKIVVVPIPYRRIFLAPVTRFAIIRFLVAAIEKQSQTGMPVVASAIYSQAASEFGRSSALFDQMLSKCEPEDTAHSYGITLRDPHAPRNFLRVPTSLAGSDFLPSPESERRRTRCLLPRDPARGAEEDRLQDGYVAIAGPQAERGTVVVQPAMTPEPPPLDEAPASTARPSASIAPPAPVEPRERETIRADPPTELTAPLLDLEVLRQQRTELQTRLDAVREDIASLLAEERRLKTILDTCATSIELGEKALEAQRQFAAVMAQLQSGLQQARAPSLSRPPPTE